MKLARLIRTLPLLVTLLASASHAQVEATLPAYKPEPAEARKDAGYYAPDGSIRIIGAGEMSGMIARWNELYTRTHPGTRFTYIKSNSLAALYSLAFDAAALGPSTQEFAPGLTYNGIVHGDPVAIRVAHASPAPAASFSPLAVIVNKANPMEKISTGQLGSIFAQNTRQRVFARWSQAGVKGPLAEQEILPVGLPWSDHYPSEDLAFGDVFFFRKLGATEPVRTYRMVPTYADVVKEVAAHPEAIGVTALNRVTPDVKVLSIGRGPLKPAVSPTAETIRSGQYGLDRYLRLYLRVGGGKPIDPIVREYMRMVLSKEGQQIVADDPAGFLPLNPFEVAEDLASFQ